eukprot:1867564-Ditylum_brightwellii.AAC.1
MATNSPNNNKGSQVVSNDKGVVFEDIGGEEEEAANIDLGIKIDPDDNRTIEAPEPGFEPFDPIPQIEE